MHASYNHYIHYLYLLLLHIDSLQRLNEYMIGVTHLEGQYQCPSAYPSDRQTVSMCFVNNSLQALMFHLDTDATQMASTLLPRLFLVLLLIKAAPQENTMDTYNLNKLLFLSSF